MARSRTVLAVLVIAAFALRLGFFLSDQQPSESAGLTSTQGEMAHNIIHSGRWFKLHDPTVPGADATGHVLDPSDRDWAAAGHKWFTYGLHMPGVALIEAGIWSVTGDEDFAYIQVLQCLLGALSVLLVYRIAMLLFARPRAALIAAGLYAFHPAIAYEMRIPYYDSWALLSLPLITLLALEALVRVRENRPAMRWLVATGVATGVALYFRPPLGFAPVLIGLAAVPQLGLRRAAKQALVPAAIALVILVPYTIRNATEFHKFIPANTGLGQVTWEGFGEISNDFGAKEDDEVTYNMVHARRPALVYGTPAYDAYLWSLDKHVLTHEPFWYMKLVAHRVVDATLLLRNGTWAGSAKQEMDASGDSPLVWAVKNPLKALLLGMVLLEPALVWFAIGSVIALFGRYRNQFLLLGGIVVSTLIVPLLMDFEWRYVAPGIFAYLIAAGVGFDALLDRWAAQRRQPALVAQ
jgi:4-amino-4-deoxy-L-arabinose transferase-like glycosyltransferase